MLSRYCAVCHPYTYRDLTHSNSVNKRVLLYVLPVILVSILLNIPKFFETRIVFKEGTYVLCSELVCLAPNILKLNFCFEDEGSKSYEQFSTNNSQNFSDIHSSILSMLKNRTNSFQQNSITYEVTELRDNPDYIR